MICVYRSRILKRQGHPYEPLLGGVHDKCTVLGPLLSMSTLLIRGKGGILDIHSCVLDQ